MDGVDGVWHSPYRWIISQADEFLAFQTVYLITDNRDLLAATVSSTAGLSHWPMNVQSCLISAILAVLLIATAQEEFGIPECTTTIEAAGLDGPHRWGIILPNSSRVSLLTYKAIVAVRYPELVLHDQDPMNDLAEAIRRWTEKKSSMIRIPHK